MFLKFNWSLPEAFFCPYVKSFLVMKRFVADKRAKTISFFSITLFVWYFRLSKVILKIFLILILLRKNLLCLVLSGKFNSMTKLTLLIVSAWRESDSQTNGPTCVGSKNLIFRLLLWYDTVSDISWKMRSHDV